MRQRRAARLVRSDAERLARDAARERERAGDPEGAGALRDLAADIRRIRLTIDL